MDTPRDARRRETRTTVKEPQSIRGGVLAAVGRTPLVRLERYFPNAPFALYGKLEALNPGGSIKDRTAQYILEGALARGELREGGVVVESSSGNMGVGLAQACRYHRLRFICVVDAKTTAANVALLGAYGAEVDVVTEPDERGEYLSIRIARVKELLARHPNGFWPNQYANPMNPAAHVETMNEIAQTLEAPVDYLFVSTSTCGTLRGCAQFVREKGMPTKIVAVDALGSMIFGGPAAKRLIPGHGASVIPPLYGADLADQCVHVSDLECVVGCRRLALREAIVAGGSSGAVVTAVERLRDEIPKGATCVAILPDRGERYLDTVYSDAWVASHFGEVAHLWRDN